MKKLVFGICFLVCGCICGGQTPDIIKQTFYGLPLDTPRVDLVTKMFTDKRFTSKTKSNFSIYPFSYWGTINNPTFVKNKPDSSYIEITWGGAATVDSITKHPVSVSLSIFRTTYFFNSKKAISAHF